MTAIILDFSRVKPIRLPSAGNDPTPRLICIWRRDADGRLACVWESPSRPLEEPRRSRRA